jgi:hypothetical protein
VIDLAGRRLEVSGLGAHCCVVALVPGMRCIFCLGWQGMLELVESCLDITWHGDVNGAAVVVPFDGETAVKGACPVGGDGV